MNLRSLAAALKQKYRPIFRGDLDREAEHFRQVAAVTRETADEITGAGRAIASMTEGKGE